MISNFKQITDLMEELDNQLEIQVHLYLIGGGMMLYHKLKNATKDIDLIVETKKEFIVLESVLKKIGFIGRMPAAEYGKIDLSQILIRTEFRIDIFQNTVCKGFSLTESMKQRSTEILKLKHVTLSLCSYEDVFMFKTFTERPGDVDDCISLTQKELNWNAMLEEINIQIKNSGNAVWITWVGEKLDLLEEKGLFIPIMDQINKLREEYFDEYEKRHPSH